MDLRRSVSAARIATWTAAIPDAQASGLIGTATTRLATASSSPSVGLYLETLGAFVLLIIATGGLLLTPPQSPRRPARAVRRTSAS